jgi:hypothetical protein
MFTIQRGSTRLLLSGDETQRALMFAALGFNPVCAPEILGVSPTTITNVYLHLQRRYDEPSTAALVALGISSGTLLMADSDDLPEVMRERLQVFDAAVRAFRQSGLTPAQRAYLEESKREPVDEAWTCDIPSSIPQSLINLAGLVGAPAGATAFFASVAAAARRLTDFNTTNAVTEEELRLNLAFAALGFITVQSKGILGLKSGTLQSRYTSLLSRFPQPTVGMLVVRLICEENLDMSGLTDMPEAMKTRMELFSRVTDTTREHGLNATQRGWLMACIQTVAIERMSIQAWKLDRPPNYVRSIRNVVGQTTPSVGNPPTFMAAAAAAAGQL